MKLFVRFPILLPAIPIRVRLYEPGVAKPPPEITAQEWFIDTGFSGEAFAWREHLEAAGLDPEQNLFPGSMVANSSLTIPQLMAVDPNPRVLNCRFGAPTCGWSQMFKEGRSCFACH